MIASADAFAVTPPASSPPGVRVERSGAAVTITLDRPDKLNAVNSGMKRAIATEIPVIARDPQVYAVLLRAAPSRMFSAGGDIREIHALASTSLALALEECAREYGLIWLLDCFSKPTVALIDGAVLGTGAGLVMTTTHRVAGSGYRFQMPETAIGYFPDNGVAWHLARLPGSIGIWLGLTGAMLEPADAYNLKLVTHCIDAGHHDAIQTSLSDAQPIDPLLDGLHRDPGPAPLAAVSATIAHCFSAPTVAGIIDRLQGARDHRAWCEAQLQTLASRSPMALAITLELLRRAQYLDLAQVLTLEYRLARSLVGCHDFFEAVRTRIIEKRGEPAWRPGHLSDIDQRDVEGMFDIRGEGELVLPTRQEMQIARM